MLRWIARIAGTALIVGILAAPALALDPFEQARWQIAANQARVTLLVPETPGFALQEISPRSLTCGGDTLGEAFATWASPDGRNLQLIQGRPFSCGDGPESTLILELVVSGKPATYSRYDGEPEATWRLAFEREGARLDLEANRDDLAPLVAMAEGAVPIAPSPSRALTFTQLTAQVIKTVGADVVVVNSDDRREVVRLAGIRAPQPGRGGRAAGCRFKPAKALLGRALPRGAAVLIETDPLRRARDAKGRLLGYVSRKTAFPSGTRTANYDLITAGAVRVAGGRFRYRGRFVSAERLARRDDRGLFGKLCEGSLAPPERPKPPVDDGGTGNGGEDPPPRRSCDPNYRGACVPPYPPDLDCDDIPAVDFLRVGDDPHGLDGDGNGVACES